MAEEVNWRHNHRSGIGEEELTRSNKEPSIAGFGDSPMGGVKKAIFDGGDGGAKSPVIPVLAGGKLSGTLVFRLGNSLKLVPNAKVGGFVIYFKEGWKEASDELKGGFGVEVNWCFERVFLARVEIHCTMRYPWNLTFGEYALLLI